MSVKGLVVALKRVEKDELDLEKTVSGIEAYDHFINALLLHDAAKALEKLDGENALLKEKVIQLEKDKNLLREIVKKVGPGLAKGRM